MADDIINQLMDTAAHVKLMGEAALAGTPLSLLSNRMLAEVLDEPGITVAEVARRIPKTQQAMSQVAAQLTKLGLIERRLGTGRGVGLYVTESGRQLAADGQAREHEIRVRLRELLGDQRYRQLGDLLAESLPLLEGEPASRVGP